MNGRWAICTICWARCLPTAPTRYRLRCVRAPRNRSALVAISKLPLISILPDIMSNDMHQWGQEVHVLVPINKQPMKSKISGSLGNDKEHQR